MKNKIILGDCIDVMKNMGDESIDLIVTDPPYLISYKTNYRKNKSHDFCSAIDNDDNPNLIIEYIKECYRILKNNSAMYIFCSPKTVDFFKKELEKYFKIKNQIIWVKNNWTAGDLKCSFGFQYEICFLLNKGKKKFNGKRLTDVWFFERVSGKKQVHQNQKPLDFIKQCIEKHSNEGDVIFDGFAGSGTTAIACINMNRYYICIEKDEKYYNFMKNRVNIENET